MKSTARTTKERMMGVYLLIMLALVFLLPGCTHSEASQRVEVRVVEITLSDGTRCAVYDRHNRGGMSCDWGQAGNNH